MIRLTPSRTIRDTASIYTDPDALPLAEVVAKLPVYADDATPEHAHGRTRKPIPSGPAAMRFVSGRE